MAASAQMLLGLLLSKTHSIFYLNTTFFIRLFAILKRRNRQCFASLTLFLGLRSAYGCSSSFQHKAWNTKEKDWYTQPAVSRRGKSNPPCSEMFQSHWATSSVTAGTLPLVTWWVSSQQHQAGSKQPWESNTVLWENPSQHGQVILLPHCFPTGASLKLHTICTPRLALGSYQDISSTPLLGTTHGKYISAHPITAGSAASPASMGSDFQKSYFAELKVVLLSHWFYPLQLQSKGNKKWCVPSVFARCKSVTHKFDHITSAQSALLFCCFFSKQIQKVQANRGIIKDASHQLSTSYLIMKST